MKLRLKKISKFFSGMLTFVGVYLAIIGSLWTFAEPITHFSENLLKETFGCYWWLFFYAIPLLLAFIPAVATHRKANHKPFLDEFNHKTERILAKAQLTITGTGRTFEKDEVQTVEEQLKLERPVLITGNAGTGKSGIGVFLAKRAKKNNQQTLVIDARQLQHIQDEQSLRNFYRSEGPVERAIGELINGKGFRLIIDQLDNTAGRPISDILIELAVECCKMPDVEVIIISRRQEAYERRLLEKLSGNGFAEVICHELDEVRAQEELEKLGFENPSTELIKMCRNLLNLEIVSNIKQQNEAFVFEDIENEVALWDGYLETLQNRESVESDLAEAERTLTEAMRLAKKVLASNEQEFTLENPLSPSQRRLVSWSIIVHDEGVKYRFRHEKLQDYLYARHAAERKFLPKDVLSEIGAIRSRNAIVWLDKIYRYRKSLNNIQFLEDLFDA